MIKKFGPRHDTQRTHLWLVCGLIEPVREPEDSVSMADQWPLIKHLTWIRQGVILLSKQELILLQERGQRTSLLTQNADSSNDSWTGATAKFRMVTILATLLPPSLPALSLSLSHYGCKRTCATAAAAAALRTVQRAAPDPCRCCDDGTTGATDKGQRPGCTLA